MGVTHKTELDVIDGTPEKRFFLSLISDYDLKAGLCELVDNAIDFWRRSGSQNTLIVDVDLDPERQILRVSDNAGGVSEADIRLLIAPGATGNQADEEVIGIFGVGGKRAAVALGERVEIRTRHKKGKSLQIDLTSEWLQEPGEWKLPVYEVPDLQPGTTVVDVSKLRQTFDKEDVEIVREHVCETYSWYILNGCEIRLNGTAIEPITFDHWAYPPGFGPQEASFKISPTADGSLDVSITGGLILDRDPEKENYGVYIYCNHRLVVKELRTRDVGYLVTSEAGVPHPDASLCRIIVSYQGNPDLMPWNSSKSNINPSRPAFAQIRPLIIALNKHFSKLSRRLKNDWDGEVFKYKKGKKTVIDPNEILLSVIETERELVMHAHPDYISEKLHMLNMAPRDAYAMLDSINQRKVRAHLIHWKFEMPEDRGILSERPLHGPESGCPVDWCEECDRISQAVTD